MHAFTEAATVILLLGVLLLLVLVVLSILFQFRWLVPFVPTPMSAVNAMVDLAKLRPGQTVMDLGAGDARFLIAARAREPKVKTVGYEGAVCVWMLGKLRLALSGNRDATFRMGNFLNADLSKADVIFTYLSINVMKKLLPKFQRELRPGTLILSHAFRLPGLTPIASRKVPMPFGGSCGVYCYRVGKKS